MPLQAQGSAPATPTPAVLPGFHSSAPQLDQEAGQLLCRTPRGGQPTFGEGTLVEVKDTPPAQDTTGASKPAVTERRQLPP